jgi:hypothetical protein
MKVFLTLTLSFIISSLYAQTCTSSGGDDILDIDDHPYRFRCGNDRMFYNKKVSEDYKLIETCNNYWAEGNYYKKGNKIYYSPKYGEFELVVGANAADFKCEDATAKDGTQIFYLGKVVKNINKSSYKAVGKLYCKDDNKVYFKNKYAESDHLIQLYEAKPNNFQLIGDSTSYYAKDDSLVYYYGKIVINADPESFEVIGYGYSHDKNFAYYNGELISGLKGEGFSVLKDCYLGSDGVTLCNGKMKIDNSDAKTFTIIECGYYKDKNQVYLNGKVLENIDSQSFEILSWGYTKDKNAVYCDLKLIENANPNTFEVLARKHSRDDKNIFYLSTLMECDYSSFKIDPTKDYLSSDNSHQYSRGKIINN